MVEKTAPRLYLKFVLTLLIAFVLGYFIWLKGVINTDNLKDTVFDIGQIEELKIDPDKAALIPGEKQLFYAIGKYGAAEQKISVSWRIEPANIGTLACNTGASNECTFVPSKTPVTQEGHIVITKNGLQAKSELAVFSDTLQAISFTDVKATNWYFPAVYDLFEKGILENTGKPEFGVQDLISRADFIILLQKTLDYLNKNDTSSKICRKIFDDVSNSSDYASSLCSFYKNGWISGYKEENRLYFKPKEKVTRAQAAKFICSPFCKDLARLKILPNRFYFADLSPYDPYTKDISLLASFGIIKGKGENQFAMDDYVTKVEAVTMIHRLLSLLESKKAGVARADIVAQEPKIKTISPDHGEGRHEFTLKGHGFGPNGLVMVYYISDPDIVLGVAGFEQKNSSDNEIVIPDLQVYGDKVFIKVLNAEKESNEMIYTIIHEGQPGIESMTPDIGTEKQMITLSGFAFGPRESSFVQIMIKRPRQIERTDEVVEDLIADYITQDGILSWNDSQIILDGIQHTDIKNSDIIDIRVIKKIVPEDGKPERFLESNAVYYGIDLEKSPVINSIEPEEGNLSDLIKITGRGFGGSPADITSYDQDNSVNIACYQKMGKEFQVVGGGDLYPRSLVYWSENEIVLKNLADYCNYLHAGDKVVLTVKAKGNLSNGGNYYYLAREAYPPVITSISDDIENEAIEIIGQNFGGTGSVYVEYLSDNEKVIGNAKLPITTWTDTKIVIPSFPVNGKKALIKVVTRGMESNAVSYEIKDREELEI